MPKLPGWGTVAGFVAKWVDPLFDPKKKIDRKIEKLKRKRDALLTKKSKTPDDHIALGDVTRQLSSLLKKRNRLT